MPEEELYDIDETVSEQKLWSEAVADIPVFNEDDDLVDDDEMSDRENEERLNAFTQRLLQN